MGEHDFSHSIYIFHLNMRLHCLLVLPLNMNLQGNKEDGNAANHTMLLEAVRVSMASVLAIILINFSAPIDVICLHPDTMPPCFEIGYITPILDPVLSN